ncbi:MAG: EAL domain-containing protein [Pseudomonadota bacterium]
MQPKKLLSATFLIELIEQQRYGVEYQPIIDVKTRDTYAYECLSRFFKDDGTSIPPDLVYASLHGSPLSLFQVEFQKKKLQLNHAPSNEHIFVNLDQDSYFSCEVEVEVEVEVENNPFLQLFSAYKKADITVELIENSEINDAIMSLAMIDCLSKSKISTAIDDVCDQNSMISTSVLQLVNYIKLDKAVISNKHNADFLQLVKFIIGYGHATRKKIILEGIETEEDLLFAKQLGCDFVQGYLFRPQFLTAN